MHTTAVTAFDATIAARWQEHICPARGFSAMPAESRPPARRQPAQPARAWVPRGMRRGDASAYVGMSASKFAEMVAAGKMPPPMRVGAMAIWDRVALDDAFTALAAEAEAEAEVNEWD